MNGFIRILILVAMVVGLNSCTSQPVEDEDFSFDSTMESPEDLVSDSGNTEDFSDFDEDPSVDTASNEASGSEASSLDDEFNLEVDEGESVAQNATPENTTTENAPAAADEFSEFDLDEPTDVATSEIPVEDPFADTTVADVPAPAIEEPVDIPLDIPAEDPFTAPLPVVQTEPPVMPSTAMARANITDLQYKANDAGGTIVVQGDRELTYTTRLNPESKQFVIEVENANLPTRLKRTLNTKDIKGSIGAIDAYQTPGSDTARIVIQLRDGVAEPTVQAEGRSLLIVANPEAAAMSVSAMETENTVAESNEDKILPSQDLSGFLAGNTKFYGKKISIETNNINVRDALSFITEESGVNMVVAEEVTGSVSLKLRQVPWDQALVVIMKAKKLGYTRQGNVLRIAPLVDLKAEEDDATKLVASKRTIESLKVRMFPVSYAKVDELEKKIKDFLGERGKVVGDVRTNALVVTDIEENLDRAAKLISSLDTPPAQVLIEGKLVEAQESFSRTIGVNWGASGAPISLGSTARGPLSMTPSLGVNQSANMGPGNLNFNVYAGTMDVFGTLSAALSLAESEAKAKVISSPRIMTMTNELASITQTTEVAVKTVTQTEMGLIETFTFKPLTLKLEVTPQVTFDGSVIMKVNLNRQFRGADVNGVGNGAFSVNSREALTRVLVKNGQTAVIGGIYQSDATDGVVGVPWFKDLPIIGHLFKVGTVTKDKMELMVFLTPRVIGQADVNPEPVQTDEGF